MLISITELYFRKLCVESKLPKESQLSSNSKDPYEFTLIDQSAASRLGHSHLHNPVLNNNKPTVKSKSKPSSSRSKSKESSSSAGAKSPAHLNNTMISNACGAKRKRSGSGSNAPSASPSTNNALLAGTALQSSIGSSLSTFTAMPNNTAPLTAIAIPSVNLSSSTLSHYSAHLNDGKNQTNQTALLKDFNLVVRNIDPNSIVNGQYMIGNVIDEKTLLQGNKTGHSSKILNSFEALQKNHIIPANAILVDSTMQPRSTVLAPVSMGGAKSNTVISLANTSMSSQQVHPSPSAIPSNLFRTVSIY